MNRQVLGWGVAFAATATMAILLLAAASQEARPAAAPPPLVVKRDPSKITDIELELILNKVREGDLLGLKGDRDGARRAWAEARRLGEGLWPIHEGLADSYARAKLWEDAIREYMMAEPLVPEKLPALRSSIVLKRAGAQAQAGRPLEAIRLIVEVAPPAQAGARVIELSLQADREAALKLVQQRAETHDPRWFGVLSALLAKLDRPAESGEALARYAIAVSPWDEPLNRRAIELLRAAKKFDPAVEVCRAWVRSTPAALQAYEIMGDLLREAGRPREAFVAYSSIVDVRAGDAGAHRMLGEIFRKLDRRDEAIAQFELAKKARPEDQVTWTTLLSLYEAKGDAARSEETLMEISKKFGLSGEVRSRIVASTQEQIGRLKAEGKTEEVRKLRRKLADLNVPEGGLFDLKVIMTWDVASDVDMDVHEPDGTHVHHGQTTSKSGGKYYVDNTQSFGPETYTLAKAPPGTYRVGAHLHSGQRSSVKFVLILFEDTPFEARREETFVLEKQGEQKFIRDVVVSK